MVSQVKNDAIVFLPLTTKRECDLVWIDPFKELKGERSQFNMRHFLHDLTLIYLSFF